MYSLYLFNVMPNVSLKPLEALFRARLITFLVDKGASATRRMGHRILLR